MNSRERNRLDEHIAGGRRSSWAVQLKCVEERREGACNNAEDCKHEIPCDEERGCGWADAGRAWSEYGTSGTEPEDCPECGGELEAIE